MNRVTVQLLRLSGLVLFIALVAEAGPACPEGYAHDSAGKCSSCADGYVKNAKTGACAKSTAPKAT